MNKTKEQQQVEAEQHYSFGYPFPPRHNTSFWSNPNTLMGYDEAVEAFHQQPQADQDRRKSPVLQASKTDSNSNPYPFPPKNSMSWQNNVHGMSYDEAVNLYQQANVNNTKIPVNPVTLKKAPTVNPKNMYWPPYNPTAPEGKKQIEINYTDAVAQLSVMSPEEWEAFFDTFDILKSYKDLATGLYNTVEIPKALGGIGVKAVFKEIDGIQYLVLKDYDVWQQKILYGGVFKANNVKVVRMGIGALSNATQFVRYVRISAPIDFLVGSAVNILQFIVNDAYTLEKLEIEEAKLFVSIAAAAALAFGIGVAIPTTITVGAGIAIFCVSSFAIWAVDQFTDFEEKLAKKALEVYK